MSCMWSAYAKGVNMKYVATIRIPTIRPNKNRTTFSKECALKQLEEMKKQYNVIWSEWIAGDLVIEFEVEI